jgi:hypothetical protein
MSYEILMTGEGLSILHITEANFNSFEGWRIKFHDGREAMLYKGREQWMQYQEDWLDEPTITAVGKCIDNRRIKKSHEMRDSFFYDLLVN